MRVIILAAGKSRRFQEAKFLTPKPFLQIEWRGCTEPMLCHVLQSVPIGYPISVAIPSGYLTEAQLVTQKWPQITFKEIAETIGPADTLRQMLTGDGQPLLVLDVDVINHTNDLVMLSLLNCSGVLVSKSTNPSYSYVTNLGSFFHIKEKERISSYAVRGAYYIITSDVVEFKEYLKIAIKNYKEPFVSHALDLLPNSKFALKTFYDPIEWGTPLDVKLSHARIVTGE